MRSPRLLLVLMLPLVLAACNASPKDHVVKANLPERDTALARRHIERGIEAMRAHDLGLAEAAFRAALEADAFSGVAHNNLGKVYYHQHRLYHAAQEFQYAARLLPHHPEPRNNLGLVLEAAGQLDEAVEEYNRALAAQPDNPQLLGNLIRARVRRGDKGKEMKELLTSLVMKEDRPTWLRWAQAQLTRFGAYPFAGHADPTATETQ